VGGGNWFEPFSLWTVALFSPLSAVFRSFLMRVPARRPGKRPWGVVGLAPDVVAAQESYWLSIRRAFALDDNHVNLNSGSVSPAPRAVFDAMTRYWTVTNMSPSHVVDEFVQPGRGTGAAAARGHAGLRHRRTGADSKHQ
jgi:hypothetical protein